MFVSSAMTNLACVWRRWHREEEWATSVPVSDFEWQQIAKPVMDLYTESTDGSFIEVKESALVWHHRDADPDFGSWQAKELLDHLESVLANEPVVVKSGQHIVEVKPQVRMRTELYGAFFHIHLQSVTFMVRFHTLTILILDRSECRG